MCRRLGGGAAWMERAGRRVLLRGEGRRVWALMLGLGDGGLCRVKTRGLI